MDLAKMLGQMNYSTPEPQHALSNQLPTEDTPAAQQEQDLPPASTSGPQQWPVSGSQQPESDYNNVAAQMAIHLVPLIMKGKNTVVDHINAPYGSNMRYSPQ